MEHTEYMKLAARKGAELGEWIAEQCNPTDAGSIHRSAVGFVNRLPLNDIQFEADLQREFETSAIIALRNALYAEKVGA